MQLPEKKEKTAAQAEKVWTEPEVDFEYSDILYAEPLILPDHPRMDRISRAAQFAPFAALPVFNAFEMEIKSKAGENDRELNEPWTE